MGTKLKVLSGDDIVKILSSFGFNLLSQKGSHIKLRRVKNGLDETLIIPNHAPLRKGSLKAIFNQASKYISRDELYPHFYSE